MFIALPRTTSLISPYETGPTGFDKSSAEQLPIDPYLSHSFSEMEIPPYRVSLDPIFPVSSMEGVQLDDSSDPRGLSVVGS